MARQKTLTRILALLGTIAVWLPILFMLLTGAVISIRSGQLRMDYLMPAELFPLIIVGGGLLVFAAHRAALRCRVVDSSLIVAVAALVLTQALAVATGLASGAAPAEGWRFILVIGLLAIYDLAVVALGVGGILLLRDLFGQGSAHTPPVQV
jgi:hypothetical protein